MNNTFLAHPRRNAGLLALVAGVLLLPGCGGGGSSSSTYTVGGTVTGISGAGLVLQVNGGADLAIGSNGGFTFGTAFSSGSSYAVTVLSQPASQICQVSRGTGSVSANVSNVGVECRTNVNPAGYYGNTGTASVGNGAGGTQSISDFQIIASDNRFMAMSVAAGLIYDGPMTLFGDEFTATVSVYRDGLRIYTDVPVSGTIVEGASIAGTFGGTEEGAGTFNGVYASTNQDEAVISRIETGGANPEWASPIGGSTTDTAFEISSAGSALGVSDPSGGNLAGCTVYTVDGGDPVAIIPISGTSLYRVTVQLSDCVDVAKRTIDGNAGYYTGFATSRSEAAPDDVLVFMVTSANGLYATGGDFR